MDEEKEGRCVNGFHAHVCVREGGMRFLTMHLCNVKDIERSERDEESEGEQQRGSESLHEIFFLSCALKREREREEEDNKERKRGGENFSLSQEHGCVHEKL